MNQLMTPFQQRFGKPCLRRATLSFWEKVCLCRGIWRNLLRAVDQYPEWWPVLWLVLSLNDQHINLCGNNQRNLEYYIWPCLTTEGHGDVILASVCNWTQRYRHETMLQSMCFVVGMISGNFVSWESSLFRWMCSLLQLPILAKGMLVTVMHILLSGLLKLGLHDHHGSGKVVFAQLHPIHWPVNDSLRNSHTVREKCTGALSCWNDTCYIIPLLLQSGIT